MGTGFTLIKERHFVRCEIYLADVRVFNEKALGLLAEYGINLIL